MEFSAFRRRDDLPLLYQYNYSSLFDTFKGQSKFYQGEKATTCDSRPANPPLQS